MQTSDKQLTHDALSCFSINNSIIHAHETISSTINYIFLLLWNSVDFGELSFNGKRIHFSIE